MYEDIVCKLNGNDCVMQQVELNFKNILRKNELVNWNIMYEPWTTN